MNYKERLDNLSTVAERLTVKAIDWKDIIEDSFSFPSRLDICDWVEDAVVIPNGDEKGQNMKMSTTPYLADVFKSFKDPKVKYITLKKTTQSGGTFFILALMAYITSEDPSDIMFITSTEKLAGEISDRFRYVVENSPKLDKLRKNGSHDFTKYEHRFRRNTIYFCWANSVNQMASKSIKYIFFDEVNKFDESQTRKESDPISLGMERCKIFSNPKIIFCSTPTTEYGEISRRYNESNKSIYEIPCENCGNYNEWTFQDIRKPNEVKDKNVIRSSKNLVYYECPDCKHHLYEKDDVVNRGRWLISNPDVTDHHGYYISGLFSLMPQMKFNLIFEQFIKSNENKNDLKHFLNSYLGEHWKEDHVKTDIDPLKLISDVPRGECPPDTAFLITSIDAQKDETYYYTTVAFQFGHKITVIDNGIIQGDKQLNYLVNQKEYKFGNVTKKPIMSMIDTGDGNNTYRIYNLTYLHRGKLQAIKGGDGNTMNVKFSMTPYERTKERTVSDDSLSFILINTIYYKDVYFDYIKQGKLKIHCDDSIYDNYGLLDQLDSEEKRFEQVKLKNGKIFNKPKYVQVKKHNHYLDCIVYALCYADKERVYFDSLEYSKEKEQLMLEIESAKNSKSNTEIEKEKKRNVFSKLFNNPNNQNSIYNALDGFQL